MSTSPSQDWQEQLRLSLRRAQDAIAQGVNQQEQMAQASTASLRNAYPDWGRERWQRRLERKWRKRAEREARVAGATLFEGYLWMLGAILLFIVALSLAPPGLLLLIPALKLGTRGSRVISRHMGRGAAGQAGTTEAAERQRAGAPQPNLAQPGQAAPQPASRPLHEARNAAAPEARRGSAQQLPLDPRDQRVDAICDKILLELRTSPEVVKEIFRKPEETVAALRATCRDLTRRERDLRRFLAPDEDVRLSRERDVLASRVGAEDDEVTRLRLASALAALDQQRAQRQDLARSAARFDAEHTRISYTLESLYTQVVRMRSADAGSVDVAGAGLRRSLEMLSTEVNALADALEKVNEGADEHKLRGLAEAPGAADAGRLPGAPARREKA